MDMEIFFFFVCWGQHRLELYNLSEWKLSTQPLWSHFWLTGRSNYDRGKAIIHTTYKELTRKMKRGRVREKKWGRKGRREEKNPERCSSDDVQRRRKMGQKQSDIDAGVLRWTEWQQQNTQQSQMGKQPLLVHGGSQRTNCNKTIKDIESDSAACCWSDIRDRGKKSNMESLVVIPSYRPCMSSPFFEAFPHNKRIKHNRQIVKRGRRRNRSH